jgi:hypothetical protein
MSHPHTSILLRGKYGKGKSVLVDPEDYNYLSGYKWYMIKEGYAKRFDNELKTVIPMHRQIMNTPKGMHTDHINHNTLDNRKTNLRVCDRATNMQNLTKGRGYIKKVIKKDRYGIPKYVYWTGVVITYGRAEYTKYYKSYAEAKGHIKDLLPQIDKSITG